MQAAPVSLFRSTSSRRPTCPDAGAPKVVRRIAGRYSLRVPLVHNCNCNYGLRTNLQPLLNQTSPRVATARVLKDCVALYAIRIYAKRFFFAYKYIYTQFFWGAGTAGEGCILVTIYSRPGLKSKMRPNLAILKTGIHCTSAGLLARLPL